MLRNLVSALESLENRLTMSVTVVAHRDLVAVLLREIAASAEEIAHSIEEGAGSDQLMGPCLRIGECVDELRKAVADVTLDPVAGDLLPRLSEAADSRALMQLLIGMAGRGPASAALAADPTVRTMLRLELNHLRRAAEKCRIVANLLIASPSPA